MSWNINRTPAARSHRVAWVRCNVVKNGTLGLNNLREKI